SLKHSTGALIPGSCFLLSGFSWLFSYLFLVTSYSSSTLFLTFLKIRAAIYGSGYVLLAYLHTDFVDRLHWLTDKQLIDAVAVGQFTPGPVFTTATFIGYLTGSWTGAVVATVAIFLPSFLFVAAVYPLIPRVRGSPIAG